MSDLNHDPSHTAQPVVYVRAIEVATLPDSLREQAMGAETIYAVHDSAGERLAPVRERGLAFMLARQNEMEPVSVH